ncbi:MAG TPA: flagellar protein FlgN [bacterium]|nr:flagellar protein FlgN [bacterium]
MQEKIKKLLNYLNTELSYYESLLDYSKAKNKSLIERNIDDISIITQKEEKLVSKIKDTEKYRIELLKEISKETNIKFEDLNISAIANYAQDEKTKNELLEKKKILSEILEELRKYNDQNTELIKQALDVINHTVRVMNNTMNNPNLYNKQKQEQVAKNQQSFLFDKKV